MRSVFFPELVNEPFGDPALYVSLAHRGEALLFDCGDIHCLPPRKALKIKVLFLSHLHIDHVIGFDALIRIFLGRDKLLYVYGPKGTVDCLSGRLAGYTWNLTESYTLRVVVREWDGEELREVSFLARGGFRSEGEKRWDCRKGVLWETPAYSVKAVPLDHGGIVSLAYALEEPLHVAIHKDALEKYGYLPGPWLTPFKDRVREGGELFEVVEVPLLSGGKQKLLFAELVERISHRERGMKLCYVTDVGPTAANMETIEAFVVDAHLLAIEAPFRHSDYPRALERAHLTARIAGGVAARADVARLLTFHYSPRYKDSPDLLRQEADEAFAGGHDSAGEDQLKVWDEGREGCAAETEEKSPETVSDE